MPAPSALDVLAEELGVVAGRIERESSLRIAAALADLHRREAERELYLSGLVREVREALAKIKDGAPGQPGASVTVADVAPLIVDEVARVVALLPAAKDGTSVTVDDVRPMIDEVVRALPAAKDGTSITVDDVRPMLQDMVAALPPAEKGADADPAVIERMVSDAVAALPPPEPGKSVTVDDVRPMLEEMVAALPKAERGADADPAVIERMVSDAVAALPAPEPGKSVTVDDVRPMLQEMVATLPVAKDGESVTLEDVRPLIEEAIAAIPAPVPGKEGPPGKLPIVAEWSDIVHYEGSCVTHDGATYQALRDTGREPPHEDWRCIARAGRDGTNGRSLSIATTYDPEKSDYRELDVVALNGGSFVARRDNPGVCPGDGWQLMASQGRRGQTGEPGKRGEPGREGDAGSPVVALNADAEGIVTLTNGDGSLVHLDLYPLFSKVQG